MTNDVLTAEALNERLVKAYPSLSPQLQRIAQHVLDNPNSVATSTIADLSEIVGVQPSGFIRFSKAVGFNGFSDIQKIVKSEVRMQGAPADYFERLRHTPRGEATDSITRFRNLAALSLDALPPQQDIQRAAELIAAARITHIIGQRRAFGIASYLNYLLGQFDAPINLMAMVGGMLDARKSIMTSEDCLITLTFPNYTSVAVDITHEAKAQGVKIVAITDSIVSPVASLADVLLLTDTPADTGFRSAVGSMVTAQALATTYGELKNRTP